MQIFSKHRGPARTRIEVRKPHCLFHLAPARTATETKSGNISRKAGTGSVNGSSLKGASSRWERSERTTCCKGGRGLLRKASSGESGYSAAQIRFSLLSAAVWKSPPAPERKKKQRSPANTNSHRPPQTAEAVNSANCLNVSLLFICSPE
ncbi:MAG: hypothetical protein IJZ19_06860 [Lentisphaeria bacterium]|nr:hypothetical protein [Lentisphaeria bacterium]